MKKSSRLLLAGGILAAGAAAVAGAVHYATGTLVREALNREEPKAIGRAKERIISYSADEKLLAHTKKAGEELANRPTERIEITSFDGVHLVGHLYPAEDPRRILLAVHGWRTSWHFDFGEIAEFYRENGCTVLYVEQRAQGESGGDYMSFGLLERYDCLEWLRYLEGRFGGDVPIYLAGISMGATTVLMCAGFGKLPGNIRGVMADCGFTSPEAIWKEISRKNLRIPYQTIRREVDAFCRRKIAMHADAYSTLDAMKTNPFPVVFFHGAADGFVPVWMTRENYEACTAPKRMLVVEGADHGQSYLVDRESYETTLVEFWRDFDEDPASAE